MTDAPPTRLPYTARYEFHQPLGSGGAGTVYRATDRRTGGEVAVKVLRAGRGEDPVQHQRLAVEFRAASALEHPNIVRALDAGTDGEVSYLVYELVEAETLTERLGRRGRLPEAEAVSVVTQVAQALEHAHRRRVVHRDVKPDNVLVLADGRAKLADFGLAKDLANPGELTRHAGMLGTVNYMAPEQFADARGVGPRADVYALAATLYAAVANQLPFDGRVWTTVLANKEGGRFVPLAALVPGASGRLDAAVRRALAPAADDRPASCLEFVRLLVGRHRPTAAPPSARPAGADRRADPRVVLTFGTEAAADPDLHGGGAAERWPAVLQDLSAGGVQVLLARRFEPGTELAVDLPPAGDRAVRVVRVRADRAGHWVHGCRFAARLGPRELRAVLACCPAEDPPAVGGPGGGPGRVAGGGAPVFGGRRIGPPTGR